MLIFQAGQGDLAITGGEGAGFSGEGIKGSEGMRSGGFGTFDTNSLEYKTMVQSTYQGILFSYSPDKDMSNILTAGDSGSGIFAYDSKNKKWVLLGVSSEVTILGMGNISFVGQSDFYEYRKGVEQTINLGGGNWVLGSSGIENGKWTGIQRDKDLILQSGGTIEFKQDIDRNQSGAIGSFVFEADSGASSSNPTTYTIKSKQDQNGTKKDYGFNGAGLDIPENVLVNWQVGFIDNSKFKAKDNVLHKIVKGTLKIQDRTNNTALSDNKYGYLRVGEGKVIFDTDKQAFQGMYITSGRATIELEKGKGQGFGAEAVKPPLDTNIKNHFQLKQEHNEDMGLTFGNGGGTLDFKGNSFTMNTIVSNDVKANIINTDSDKSYLIFEGLGYNHSGDHKKNNTKTNTIIHASFGQSTDSKNDNSAKNSNIVIKYAGLSNDEASKNAHLIFDGNVNVKGMEITDGNVTLQGHPIIHGYIRNSNLVEKIKKAEGSKLPSWMDIS